ncbi:MAG: dTDP-4-dehydrorhamnose reductase [Kiritimatiellae bacterium]|nr:dTDP-4-dehydrorhamnose reductase [Kiritimatiellia bacterium]
MKVLVAGHRGQLGRDCYSVLGSAHDLQGADLPEMNLLEPGRAHAWILESQADVVVNCAAYTRVDDAERPGERELCRRLNAELPGILAAACRETGAHLIHISTDYVFDGLRQPPKPYVESDATGPLSWYGQTKLEGEEAVRRAEGAWTILRTAWLYGAHGRNFPRAILSRAARHPDRPLRVVQDQYGSPTWSRRLALQIQTVAEAGPAGLCHATSEGWCTWFDFARALLEEAGLPNEIVPCATADYPTLARRPANSILENAALNRVGLNRWVDWRADVSEFMRMHGADIIREERMRPMENS